jgi:uncharacterized membrane protein (DUF373 family)
MHDKLHTNPISKQPSKKTFIFSNEWHAKVVDLLVGILMIAIYFWITVGLVELMLSLYHAYIDGWAHGAEQMIKDVVVILASLELIRVLQSYLTIGRVKVTFIIDVALVVLIGELISFWYSDFDLTAILLSVFVITVLVVLRIVTSKYSPDGHESHSRPE